MAFQKCRPKNATTKRIADVQPLVQKDIYLPESARQRSGSVLNGKLGLKFRRKKRRRLTQRMFVHDHSSKCPLCMLQFWSSRSCRVLLKKLHEFAEFASDKAGSRTHTRMHGVTYTGMHGVTHTNMLYRFTISRENFENRQNRSPHSRFSQPRRGR